MSSKNCPTLPTSKSAFQIYNPSDNQMLVLKIIQKVTEASTCKLSRTMMSTKFQHFWQKSMNVQFLSTLPTFKNHASDFKLNDSFRTEVSLIHIIRIVSNLKRLGLKLSHT